MTSPSPQNVPRHKTGRQVKICSCYTNEMIEAIRTFEWSEKKIQDVKNRFSQTFFITDVYNQIICESNPTLSFFSRTPKRSQQSRPGEARNGSEQTS